MKRRITMRCAARIAIVAFCFLTHPLRAAAQYSNLEIPTAADGYSISVTKNTSENAPAGYSGHIEHMEELAVGREPAVIGRTYKSTFTLSNKIRNCPRADGTAEGDGEFTVGGTFTHTVGSTTYSSVFSMSAKAKYKGKVGDDGFVDGPVTADIDYAYTVAPAPSARIDPVSPLPTSITQHISIQFEVAKGKMEGPSIGAFTGGDPTKGQLNQANAMGLILTYWGGVWFDFAQLNWLEPGNCVQVVFDPPSFSRQPVPGSDVKVLAYIKTKGGEGVRGKFPDVKPFDPYNESVAVTSSATDPGSPAYFTYTAPNKMLKNMGFKAFATSRGGNAQANWETGLGTNWSGQITVSKISPGVDNNSDLITAHHYEATRITINVKDGVGTADGFSEVHGFGENKHYVADGKGGRRIETIEYGTDEGTAQGQVKATATVVLDTLTHHYSIETNFLAPFPTGRRSSNSCTNGKCTSRDDPFTVPLILPIVGGKLGNDLNHVSGTLDLGAAPMFPGASPVAGSYLVTWDLSRIGTTK